MKKNFGHKPDTRDITVVPSDDLPDHELLVGGFPCQSFSIAGKRRGFDDTRGTLFFEIARILKDKKTKYFILENVKGLLSHDNGNTFKTIIATLDELGYDLQWQVLNSKNFGVPQNRERVFIIGHLRGTPRPKVFSIGQGNQKSDGKSMEGEISATITATYWKGNKGTQIKQMNNPIHSNDRVYAEEGISPTLNTMQGGRRQPFVALTERRTEEAKRLRRMGVVKDTRSLKELTPREDDLANTVTTGDVKNSLIQPKIANTNMSGQTFENDWAGTLRAGASHNYQTVGAIRRLTPLECERLQGFPDNWTEGVSDTQRYKQMGNAVTVNVVEAIISRLALN